MTANNTNKVAWYKFPDVKPINDEVIIWNHTKRGDGFEEIGQYVAEADMWLCPSEYQNVTHWTYLIVPPTE